MKTYKEMQHKEIGRAESKKIGIHIRPSPVQHELRLTFLKELSNSLAMQMRKEAGYSEISDFKFERISRPTGWSMGGNLKETAEYEVNAAVVQKATQQSQKESVWESKQGSKCSNVRARYQNMST